VTHDHHAIQSTRGAHDTNAGVSTAAVMRNPKGSEDPACPPPLRARLEAVLDGDLSPSTLAISGAADVRDELLTLSRLLELHLAPLDAVREVAHWQHHPDLAALKRSLEDRFLARLAWDTPLGSVPPTPDDTVAAIRRLARTDLIPAVYDWLADDADPEEIRRFLALEGGPDSGFDDLVALCQIGLRGGPKLELARNYWDEMGRGSLDAIHTELHAVLVRAMDLETVAPEDQPVETLSRSLLNPVLATNRLHQPELVGALGLIELQAGPRCRRVVQALERIGADPGSFPFYVEHAETDPWHGKAWLDEVIRPLADDPWWAEGMVRGARWRAAVNHHFFSITARLVLAA
jgi:hypothetical protein